MTAANLPANGQESYPLPDKSVTTLTDTELATRYRELVRVTDTAECGPELRNELEALATEYKERLRRRWAR